MGFVAEVDSSALSILAPVLSKGLAVNSKTDVKRQCARIIENMAKLVDEPRFLTAFLPMILPLLDKAKENVSDPEAREVCAKASAMLTRKAQGAVQLKFDLTYATEQVTKLVPGSDKPEFKQIIALASAQASMLNEINEFESAAWTKSMSKVLVGIAGLSQSKTDSIIETLRVDAQESRVVKEEEEIDDAAEVLCDLPFGLAYGNKVLMRKT